MKVVAVAVGAERQELTADSPCVFMRALMFNVSRSLMPSVEGVSEHVCVLVACVCVCVCAWSKRNLVRRFEGCVALSFSPKTLTPFPLFLQQVSQSDSHDRSICLLLLLSSLQPFSFSPRLLLLPPSSLPLSSLVHGLVLLSICCLPGEKTQRTLYANIHSAIISNLFHTHFGFHSV